MKKMELKSYFNKNDHWDFYQYYTIKEDIENKKVLVLRGCVGKDFFGYPYQVWYYFSYPENRFSAPITQLLEWGDIGYGIRQHILKGYDPFEEDQYILCEHPQEAYNKANEFVKGFYGNGSKFLSIYEVSEYTPVGDYFY